MQRLLMSALLCASATLAQAEIYKWVDAQGHTQYSDHPQAVKDVKTVHVTVSKGVGQVATPGQKSLSDQEADFNKRRKEAASAADKETKDAAQEKEKAEYCTSLKAHLSTLNSGMAMITYDANGKATAMPAAGRAAQVADTQQKISENCQ